MKCKFEEFLVNYQEDLKRIVGKHLSTYLHIKVEDVVSIVNYQLIKTKDKFFGRFGYNFNKPDFTKWAYSYARNLTKWEAMRYVNKDKKLKDGSFYTEDGEKSLFDIVSEEVGEENQDLEEFDGEAKIQLIEDIINKYSHILTPVEKKVFSGLLHGETELEIAQAAEVSRQAVNITKIKVTEKIRSHYHHLSVEDVSAVSPERMDESLETVLGIFNASEVRRLKYHSTSKRPNKNLYTYALD